MPRQTPHRPRAARALLGALALATLLAHVGCADQGAETAESSARPDVAQAAPPALIAEAPAAETTPPATEIVAAQTIDPEPAKEVGPHIYAKARFVWIHTAPTASSGWYGYLTLGGSIAILGGDEEAARVPGGANCQWYKVEPMGFVCVGRSNATLDPQDPEYRSLRASAPDASSPWPFSYGESMGAPRYKAIPSLDEQRKTEWDLDEHLEHVGLARAATSPEAVAAIDKDLVGVDLSPAKGEAPKLFDFGPAVVEARKRVIPGSTVAFHGEIEGDDRTWLLSWDRALIPKDRVRPYPRSEHEGVTLGEGVELPIAYFRRESRPIYKRGDDGTITATGERWPARAWVAITGEATEAPDGERYLATREPGVFAKESDATIVTPDVAPPKLATQRLEKGDGRGTWVEISILGGWLIAYEGEKPVFATLISPGRGGLPVPGKTALETAATPVGSFRVDGKFVTATMVSSTNSLIVHTEVQYVQNFHGPHALHGAYWHDAFGEKMSGGCVNLSPKDARRLFMWSEPTVPEGWHGMRSVREMGPATIVIVHR